MGDAVFRERVKIYATDIDEEALNQARHGAYSPRQIEDVPHEALERFFERTEQRYVFRKDLRRCVIFGRNDLVQDAPISRIDLLVCRNTLMYFTAETQSQILRRFHFALDDDGYMLLGKSEMLITHTDLFAPVELKRRVFRKVVKPTLRDRLRVMQPMGSGPRADRGRQPARSGVRHRRRGAGRARPRPRADHGQRRRAQDVRLGAERLRQADSGSRAVLPSARAPQPPRALDRDLRPSEIKAVHWRADDLERVLDVRLDAAQQRRGAMGTSIAYIDVTETHRLQDQLTGSKRGARAGLRGAAVDGRGARDDQRGAPVDQRGARDDERGAPVDQRGARDDERGAPIRQ